MAQITVSGMSCQHCVASVTQALEKVDGVSQVAVDLDTGVAAFAVDPAADPGAVTAAAVQAVEAIGFSAKAGES